MCYKYYISSCEIRFAFLREIGCVHILVLLKLKGYCNSNLFLSKRKGAYLTIICIFYSV